MYFDWFIWVYFIIGNICFRTILIWFPKCEWHFCITCSTSQGFDSFMLWSSPRFSSSSGIILVSYFLLSVHWPLSLVNAGLSWFDRCFSCWSSMWRQKFVWSCEVHQLSFYNFLSNNRVIFQHCCTFDKHLQLIAAIRYSFAPYHSFTFAILLWLSSSHQLFAIIQANVHLFYLFVQKSVLFILKHLWIVFMKFPYLMRFVLWADFRGQSEFVDYAEIKIDFCRWSLKEFYFYFRVLVWLIWGIEIRSQLQFFPHLAL